MLEELQRMPDAHEGELGRVNLGASKEHHGVASHIDG